MHITINDPKQLGGLLLGRRREYELSQAQVAEKLGLSQSRLSELEANPQTLTVEQLLPLLKLLGLEIALRNRGASKRNPKVEW